MVSVSWSVFTLKLLKGHSPNLYRQIPAIRALTGVTVIPRIELECNLTYMCETRNHLGAKLPCVSSQRKVFSEFKPWLQSTLTILKPSECLKANLWNRHVMSISDNDLNLPFNYLLKYYGNLMTRNFLNLGGPLWKSLIPQF